MKPIRLENYDTLLFDCDGVILNSNNIKTAAFWEVGEHFFPGSGKELSEYHLANGGVSRYRKFEFYLDFILPKYTASDQLGLTVEKLATMYGGIVKTELEECEVAEDLHQLKDASNAQWFVISGSDQRELRAVLKSKNLTSFFDGGIYGSPRTKVEIINQLEAAQALGVGRRLFFGDNRVDFEAAKVAGADFCFVSEWTEMPKWEDFVIKNDICVIDRLLRLLS